MGGTLTLAPEDPAGPRGPGGPGGPCKKILMSVHISRFLKTELGRNHMEGGEGLGGIPLEEDGGTYQRSAIASLPLLPRWSGQPLSRKCVSGVRLNSGRQGGTHHGRLLPVSQSVLVPH